MQGCGLTCSACGHQLKIEALRQPRRQLAGMHQQFVASHAFVWMLWNWTASVWLQRVDLSRRSVRLRLKWCLSAKGSFGNKRAIKAWLKHSMIPDKSFWLPLWGDTQKQMLSSCVIEIGAINVSFDNQSLHCQFCERCSILLTHSGNGWHAQRQAISQWPIQLTMCQAELKNATMETHCLCAEQWQTHWWLVRGQEHSTSQNTVMLLQSPTLAIIFSVWEI